MLDYGPDAILMKGLDGSNWHLKDYEARGGYGALKDVVYLSQPVDRVIE